MVPRRRKRTKMDSTVLLLGFLIFCTLNCASARLFTVLGPNTPVIVSAGDDALLRCRLSIDDALTEVHWYRIQSDKASIIYLYQAGKDQHEYQIPSYAGRTELLRENITHGDVSLKISKIGPSDEGQYRCYLETDYYFDMADFELKVTAVGSAPSFYIEKVKDDSIKVTCKSDGWYPVPKVLNENANGPDVMTTRQEDGFYRVQYSRVITEKSHRSFSCAFESSSSDQRQEASLHASDRYFEKPSAVSTIIMAYGLIVPLIVAAAVALTAVYFYFKKRERSAKGNSESVPLETCEEGNSESVPLETCEEGNSESVPLKTCDEDTWKEQLDAVSKQQDTLKEQLALVSKLLAGEKKEKDTLKVQLDKLFTWLVDLKARVGPDTLEEQLAQKKKEKDAVSKQQAGEKKEKDTLKEQLDAVSKHLSYLYLQMLVGRDTLQEQLDAVSKHLADLRLNALVDYNTLQEQLDAVSEQRAFLAVFVGHVSFSEENISLDPDTAHPKLTLSGDQKIVRYKKPTASEMTGSNTAGRFDTTPCIMGTAGFTGGRHSWVVEVQTEGGKGWAIGLIYKSVRWVGQLKLQPREGIWAVGQVMAEYQAFDNTQTRLKLNDAVRKIRIFLDYRGQLAFYNADTMSPIYTFMAKFKEEVFPFFYILDDKTTLSLC